MAKRRKKMKHNFSYKQLGNRLPDMSSFILNQLGNRINKRIQDGIDGGKDINNKNFKKLSTKSSLPQRKALGQGSQPLKITRNMAKTKKTPATRRKLRFIIKMNAGKGKNSKKVQYGAYHNEGYTNKSTSRYPGTKVDKREWFGLPKEFKTRGKELEKHMIVFKKLIVSAVKK